MNSDDFVGKFTNYLKFERHYSDKTIRAYTTDLNMFESYLQKSTGFKGWDHVETQDIEVYLQRLAGKTTRTTRARKLSTLRSFYKFLVRRGLTKVDPATPIQFFVGKRKKPEFFYEKEIGDLLDSMTATDPLSLRNRAMFELFYATGMRVSEVANLRIDQIDFDIKMILVHGKGKKDRYVIFGNPAKTTLLNYLAKSRPLLLKKHADTGYVFLDHMGQPITRRGIDYAMQKVFNEGGIKEKVHPHELRHTFATQMLNHGADIRTVQELMGHSSLATTQMYTHLTTSNLQKNYDKFFPKRKD